MSSSHPPPLSSSTFLSLSRPLCLLFSLLLLSFPLPSVQQPCSATAKCAGGLCCSKYGWCGSTSEYCGSGCVSQCSSSGNCGSGPNCGSLCCSKWGYCGSTSEYCGSECNSNGGTCPGTSVKSSPPAKKSPPPVKKSPPPVKKSPPPVVQGKCGGGPNCGSMCCSQYGYCGTVDAYCGSGCNPSGGTCPGSPKSSPPPPTTTPSSGPGKMTVYWGQNGNEGSLKSACESGRYDIINLSFLNVWGSGRSPSINLAGHCDPGNGGCKGLASDIQSCQSLGKKVLISMGGADGSYGFSSDSDGQNVASYMWNTFLGGSLSSTSRPLGATPLDGIDLDIESGDSTGKVAFIKAIRIFMNAGSKKYLITAAPQCPFPDQWHGPSPGTVLGDTPQSFDYVWVQFYNNFCGYSSSSTTALTQSWKQWSDWMAQAAPNCKLSLGLPASTAAAGSGFIPQNTLLSTILPNFKKSSNFGGVMLWDVNNDINNQINGQPYSYAIKQAI